jgi:hypothetical protein
MVKLLQYIVAAVFLSATAFMYGWVFYSICWRVYSE